jgi:hypothetical protein
MESMDPPGLRAMRQLQAGMQPALGGPFKDFLRESRLAAAFATPSWLRSLQAANDKLAGLCGLNDSLGKSIEQIRNLDASFAYLAPKQLFYDARLKGLNLASAALQASAIAEFKLEAVDWSRVGERWGLDTRRRRLLEASYAGMARQHAHIVRSIDESDDTPFEPTAIPALVVQSAEEISVASDTIRRVGLPAADVDNDGPEGESYIIFERNALHEKLSSRYPALEKMRAGAWKAIQSDNPDRIRQAMASARELVKHLLSYIAPEDEVRAWSTGMPYARDGKPTREARLRYALRGISNGNFVDFINAELSTYSKLMYLLNACVHSNGDVIDARQAKIALLALERFVDTMLSLEG